MILVFYLNKIPWDYRVFSVKSLDFSCHGVRSLFILKTRHDTKKSTFTNFKEGAGSFPQFLGYLAQVKSMSNLRYYFDKRKLTQKGSGSDGDIEQFLKKDVFQACIYDGTNLTANGTLVFNTIWNNVSLRGSLFPATVNMNQTTLDSNKESFKNAFITIISLTSNSFYNFIQVK